MSRSDKIRVLQVVGSMNRGGAETWLMHVMRGIDAERFQFDFLVFDDGHQAFEDEIIALGGQLIRCAKPSFGLGFFRDCLQKIRRHGPYDVMHSHIQHFSGTMLALGRVAGIPLRIAHSHLDSTRENATADFGRRFYLRAMESLIQRFASIRLAVSGVAGSSLFGEKWLEDDANRLLYCGISLEPFEQKNIRVGLREHLGIDTKTWVVVHVGRFFPQKNHDFIVDIAKSLRFRDSVVQFLLIGDGPRRQHIEASVRKADLEGMFVFGGVRDDVASVLISVADMMILPSLFEGLPLIGMEAQAAGLPSIFSEECTREVAVIEDICDFLPIDDASLWAERILGIQKDGPRITREDALKAMETSPFNIQHGIRELEAIYAGANGS